MCYTLIAEAGSFQCAGGRGESEVVARQSGVVHFVGSGTESLYGWIAV